MREFFRPPSLSPCIAEMALKKLSMERTSPAMRGLAAALVLTARSSSAFSFSSLTTLTTNREHKCSSGSSSSSSSSSESSGRATALRSFRTSAGSTTSSTCFRSSLSRPSWSTTDSYGGYRESGGNRHKTALRMMSSYVPTAATGEEVVRAAHILVSDEDACDLALQRIVDGESFDAVALELSSCKSKDKGGDLGWFGPGQMVAEFEQACYQNDAGTMVKVKTQFGWHVIAVLQKATPPAQMQASELGDLLHSITEGDTPKDEYQFIDVREPDELKSAKVDEFENLPLSKFEEWGPMIQEGLKLDPNKKTVVMCHLGMRSMKMAQFLSMQAGFKQVYNVEGGIAAYARVDPRAGAP